MYEQFVYVAFIVKVFKLFYLQVARWVVYATNLRILFYVVVTVVTSGFAFLFCFRHQLAVPLVL